MDKIFVCWHDYDGNHVERFENVKDAEKFIAPLLVTFPDGSEWWTVFRRYWEGDEKKGEYILIPDNG